MIAVFGTGVEGRARGREEEVGREVGRERGREGGVMVTGHSYTHAQVMLSILTFHLKTFPVHTGHEDLLASHHNLFFPLYLSIHLSFSFSSLTHFTSFF